MWNSFQPPLYIVFDNIGSCCRHVADVRKSEVELRVSQPWKQIIILKNDQRVSFAILMKLAHIVVSV